MSQKDTDPLHLKPSQIVSLASLGHTVRERRRQLGMTQAELAKAAEVSRPQVSRVESGTMNPGFLTLLNLFRELKCRLVAEPRSPDEFDLDAYITSHRLSDGVT